MPYVLFAAVVKIIHGYLGAAAGLVQEVDNLLFLIII